MSNIYEEVKTIICKIEKSQRREDENKNEKKNKKSQDVWRFQEM